MSTLSIILFFFYTLGFGLGASLLAKESEDFLERNLMRIGIGLGAMLTFGLLLNLLRIPLDWRIFLLASILLISIKLYKNFKKGKIIFKNSKYFSINTFSLIMILLFSASFYMYTKGAFAYPYLEDDDSWSHAMGVKYVSIEKTVFAGVGNPLHYIDPYPPAYDMLMGILHQTNNSVYWTLKFFNALIVSLSIIFFYFFVKAFANSSKKALFATFALFAVPAFLSHFIWAIALTMPLFFVSFYAIEKIKDDKRWWITSAIVIAPTLTSSPTHSTYFGLFLLIYFIGRILVERKFFMYGFLAGFSGLLLSFILWWMPMILTYSLKGTLRSFLGTASVVNVAGTGDRVYTLSDFIFAKEVNMINNPIGIGVVLSILALIGLILMIFKYKDMFKKENYNKLVTLLWFVFAFYAVNDFYFAIPEKEGDFDLIKYGLKIDTSKGIISGVVKGLAKAVKQAENTFTASVVVSDNRGASSDKATFKIQFTNRNRPPEFPDIPLLKSVCYADDKAPLEGCDFPEATDPDGDTVLYKITNVDGLKLQGRGGRGGSVGTGGGTGNGGGDGDHGGGYRGGGDGGYGGIGGVGGGFGGDGGFNGDGGGVGGFGGYGGFGGVIGSYFFICSA